MKLATLRDGTRDGELVVVSRDLARCVAVPEIARTLQAALDDWDRTAPALAAISGELCARPAVRRRAVRCRRRRWRRCRARTSGPTAPPT